MKKLAFFLLAMGLLLPPVTSCDKDDKAKNDKKEEQKPDDNTTDPGTTTVTVPDCFVYYKGATFIFKRTVDNKWVPNCDVFHLGDGGEYFQALVWAASLFDGIDLTELEYRPPFVTEDEAKLMREIAMGLN